MSPFSSKKKVFQKFSKKKTLRVFPLFILVFILFSFIRCQDLVKFDYIYQAESLSVPLGTREILFIVDNSCSMTDNRDNLANNINSLISPLQDMRFDWRIGIATTQANLDLHLLEFQNGELFLTPDDNFLQHFRNTLQELKFKCSKESSNLSDERAIFVANQIIKNNPAGFLRTNSHLVLVIISDEDERSGRYKFDLQEIKDKLRQNSNTVDDDTVKRLYTEYLELETDDLPRTLVQNVRNLLGPRSSLSVHSIIIIPEDQHCLDIQRQKQLEQLKADNKLLPAIDGVFKNLKYGDLYNKLSNPDKHLLSMGQILKGSAVSICEEDYSPALAKIGLTLTEKVVSLECDHESVVSLEMITEDDFVLVEGSDYYISNKNQVIFSSNLPLDLSVHIDYTCL